MELGRKALARDWAGVHALLAPWLRERWSIEQVQEFFESEYRDVPADVTDDNVRYWMKLQLQSSDEQMDALGFDSFCEMWMAVVGTEEGAPGRLLEPGSGLRK